MKHFCHAAAFVVNAVLIAQSNALAAEADMTVKTAGVWGGMVGRVGQAFTSKSKQELPDEALVPASKIKWNRLAKAALDLPEWVGFGLSQRLLLCQQQAAFLASKQAVNVVIFSINLKRGGLCKAVAETVFQARSAPSIKALSIQRWCWILVGATSWWPSSPITVLKI